MFQIYANSSLLEMELIKGVVSRSVHASSSAWEDIRNINGTTRLGVSIEMGIFMLSFYKLLAKSMFKEKPRKANME